jgi:tetratricopeptide (TPR) repeat protein
VNEIAWWPGLLALGLGLGGGLWLAWRLSRSGRSAERSSDTLRRGLELRRDDLVERRDELYAELRSDPGEGLDETRRRDLETSAARVLRELEEVEDELHGAGGKARRAGQKRSKVTSKGGVAAPGRPATSAQPRSFSARHPLVSGFVLGAGMVAVVGILIFWAMRDTGGTAAPPAAAPGDEPHIEMGGLPPEAQAELEALEARLAEAPDDTRARKQLAILLLEYQQYFPAFQEAQKLLVADPSDIDGLFVEGVVRLQIGQLDAALARLDEVLQLYPDHVQALAWRGVILYQTGEVNAAVESWERGIEAAGGQHPELEEMVTAALAEEAGLAPGPPAAPPQAAAPLPAPEPEQATAEEGYPLRIELTPGEAIGSEAVLFVALRPAEGAPPVAVRRIPAPRFPLELVLSTADSMMGSDLPASGLVTARLDSDGNLSTRPADDPVAEVAASLGQWALLSLAP